MFGLVAWANSTRSPFIQHGRGEKVIPQDSVQLVCSGSTLGFGPYPISPQSITLC